MKRILVAIFLFQGNFGNNIDGQNVHFKQTIKKEKEEGEKEDQKGQNGGKDKEKQGEEVIEMEEDEDEGVIPNPHSDSKVFQPKHLVSKLPQIFKTRKRLFWEYYW